MNTKVDYRLFPLVAPELLDTLQGAEELLPVCGGELSRGRPGVDLAGRGVGAWDVAHLARDDLALCVVAGDVLDELDRGAVLSLSFRDTASARVDVGLDVETLKLAVDE
jgi:hypothetical protein